MKTAFRALIFTAILATAAQAQDTLKVLLIDGQSNHAAWPKTSPMIIQILEGSGLFDVTLSRTPPEDGRKADYSKGQPTVEDMPAELQAEWAKWQPDFSQFDVVVSNYNGVVWSEPLRTAFAEFVRNGGGFVSIHAADNAFAQWKEYNEMIGVGGWYGRNEKDGPAIYWENGALVRDPSPGKGGSHGKRSEVLVENRNPRHPIMAGLPEAWLHPADEVYCNMRGPAENITVLATAMSDAANGGSGKEQPILLALTYGKGRVFHEMLGHDELAFTGVGFQNTLIRGTEWAATGKVTYPPVAANALSATELKTRNPEEIGDAGFVSLFNGKDLTGWTPAKENPNSFLVEDGVLVLRGGRSHLFYTGDVNGGTFQNFELKIDVMTTPGSNSGVYFHTAYQEEGFPQKGYECQVNSTHTDPKKTGSLYGIVNILVLQPGKPEPKGGIHIKRDKAPSTDGEWFTYHIIVRDRQITLMVNGETTVEYTEPDGGPESNFSGRKLDGGTFALQAHDPKSEVHYKNIRVKVLD